jgi:hypothetical protein
LDDNRRRELVDATLAALVHLVGRDEHLPALKRMVEARIGPVTFLELAEACASLDVSGCPPEWRDDWAETVEALRRTARVSC